MAEDFGLEPPAGLAVVPVPHAGERYSAGARPTAEETIKAAASVLANVALDLVYKDPHQWSTRGCQTCRAVTGILGRAFGCVRFSQERQKTVE